MSPRDMREHVITPRAAVMSRDVGGGGALSESECVFGSTGGGFPLLERIVKDPSSSSVDPHVGSRIGVVWGEGEGCASVMDGKSMGPLAGAGERFAGVGALHDEIIVGGVCEAEYMVGPREVSLSGRQWCPLESEIVAVMLCRGYGPVWARCGE